MDIKDITFIKDIDHYVTQTNIKGAKLGLIKLLDVGLFEVGAKVKVNHFAYTITEILNDDNIYLITIQSEQKRYSDLRKGEFWYEKVNLLFKIDIEKI